jgi:hypothetical protein
MPDASGKFKGISVPRLPESMERKRQEEIDALEKLKAEAAKARKRNVSLICIPSDQGEVPVPKKFEQ